MGLLVVAKNWQGKNQLWLRQMTDAFLEDISVIAVPNPDCGAWRNAVPLVTLPLFKNSVPRRFARRVGIHPQWLMPDSASKVLLRLCQRRDVDAVLVHFATLALRFEDVWKRIRKPIFVHCHGWDVTAELRSLEPPFSRVHASNHGDRIQALAERVLYIANSHFTAGMLRAVGVPRSRIRVKHLSVSVSPTPPERSDHDGPIHILYLGRLIDVKGPDVVIRAFERACDLGLRGTLTIAGDGHLRLMCELLSRRSAYRDRIRLVGHVTPEEGTRLRERCDVFTMHNCTGPISGQTEAYGVSPVEAMAAGLPVVASRSGGVCETVVHGETGLLVEAGDLESHAAALIRLERDPELRVTLGLNGHARVWQFFSPHVEAYGMREILRQEGVGARDSVVT